MDRNGRVPAISIPRGSEAACLLPSWKPLNEGFVKVYMVRTQTSLSTVACGRQSARGFTLVEVIVAVLLLGILITSLYGAFSFGFTVVKANQESLRADQILVEQMENLRYYDWVKITNGFVPTNFTAYSYPTSTNQGVTYSGTVAIAKTTFAETYADSLRRATVSLSWVSNGQTRSRSMTTLISLNGICTFKP
jgi:prepilin-type N-terminal cleavage/methylation domain-containing protein